VRAERAKSVRPRSGSGKVLIFGGMPGMVLKNRRGLSKLEFYHNARKMRKELTLFVLMDFGIHSRGRKFKEDAGSRKDFMMNSLKNFREISVCYCGT
jgi:hypothetical protein